METSNIWQIKVFSPRGIVILHTETMTINGYPPSLNWYTWMVANGVEPKDAERIEMVSIPYQSYEGSDTDVNE
jgi:hypothetical protein